MSVCGCQPNCAPVVTQIPGPQGSSGASGESAFTTTTATFVIPAADGATTVTISVAQSDFLAAGVYVQIPGGASPSSPNIFKVTAAAGGQVTLVYPNFDINTNAGQTVAIGSLVVASGPATNIPVPLTIAKGGTNAITKAAAQLSLGLGQNAVASTVSGLTQAITASFVQVGAISAQAAGAGTYLVFGFFSVDWVGVTFASSRVITGKIRNVTQNTDYGSIAIDTQVLTTTTLPTSHYCIPFQVVTLANADQLQILVQISVINSAGTLTTTEASLVIVPLALS